MVAPSRPKVESCARLPATTRAAAQSCQDTKVPANGCCVAPGMPVLVVVAVVGGGVVLALAGTGVADCTRGRDA